MARFTVILRDGICGAKSRIGRLSPGVFIQNANAVCVLAVTCGAVNRIVRRMFALICVARQTLLILRIAVSKSRRIRNRDVVHGAVAENAWHSVINPVAACGMGNKRTIRPIPGID